jgi:hypothetical protein
LGKGIGMKQTAVEWLADNLHYLHSTKWDDILEQAKEMEKEHIKEAYSMGRLNKSIKEFNNNFKTEQQ